MEKTSNLLHEAYTTGDEKKHADWMARKFMGLSSIWQKVGDTNKAFAAADNAAIIVKTIDNEFTRADTSAELAVLYLKIGYREKAVEAISQATHISKGGASHLFSLINELIELREYVLALETINFVQDTYFKGMGLVDVARSLVENGIKREDAIEVGLQKIEC